MQSIPLNGILLVTSPQDLAGMVVRKAARMAERLSVPVLARLPLDPELARFCDHGQVEQYTNGNVDALAETVLQRLNE